MKQKLYIFGILITLLIFTGVIFKVNHWPAAGIMISSGLVFFVLLFLPAALFNHYKSEGNTTNRILYIFTWITCFVVFIAMLFKIMHWPYAGVAITLALPFPYVVFLPVFLYVTSRNRNFNIYNTVFILLLLALNSVFSLMLALNVSRDRINESLNLSQNYFRVEQILTQVPEMNSQKQVIAEIDKILEISGNYRSRILKLDTNSPEEWYANPGTLIRSDSRQIVPVALGSENDLPGIELQSGLKKLITTLENSEGCEGLAAIAPVLFDIYPPEGGSPDYGSRNLIWNTMAMALIYLDEVEYNLKMLKAAL